jgi:hypothetical protein
MKKLTTKQWLLLGSAIGLAYFIYNKSKNKGSDLIKEALNGTNPTQDYETGGIKPMPSTQSGGGQGVGVVPDKMLRCTDLIAEWNVIESKTTWADKTARNKARASFLGACNTNL